MTHPLPAGPYKTVETGDGPAPWYIIPFDDEGRCTAPLSRDDLVRAVENDGHTDLFLFSHGWNNDWSSASERYEDFISHYIEMRGQYALSYTRPHRPILAGIFWPSTALVAPWEQAPKFAAAGGESASAASDVAAWQREIEELATDVDSGVREEFYSLAQSSSLDDAKARRLADLLAMTATKQVDTDEDPGASSAGADHGGLKPLDGEGLLASARALTKPTTVRRKPGEFGFATGASKPTGPDAAFSVGDLDPRNLLRLATVRKMKDRAGVVGARGVGPLLRDIIAANEKLHIHLLGHSYGCIVVLSALCSAHAVPAPMVDSVLLLQPAVSQWSFAANVAGRGFPGGYRKAFERSRTPIFATYTRQDWPLTHIFHLALRRDDDVGQPRAAFERALPESPSLYAALGGFGPAGMTEDELQVIDMSQPPTRYALRKSPAPKICALRGDETITGHGDISKPATWWALFQQVEPGGTS